MRSPAPRGRGFGPFQLTERPPDPRTFGYRGPECQSWQGETSEQMDQNAPFCREAAALDRAVEEDRREQFHRRGNCAIKERLCGSARRDWGDV